VIFEDMDPSWLCSMWEAGGSAHAKHDRDFDFTSFVEA
jgi:hypothetical protein